MARIRDSFSSAGVTGAYLLLVASCGASQPSAPASSEPLVPLAVAEAELPPPATEPVVAVTAPVVQAPPPLMTHPLSQSYVGGVKRILSKQCHVVDGVCDLSTLTLAVDGVPLAFRPQGMPADAPFGEWDFLEYRSRGADNAQLAMELPNGYSYLQVHWQDASFEGFEAKVWPKMIEGVLLAASDWDGDGSSETIHFRCHAYASGDTPTDCLDTTIYSGERELLQINDEPISAEILVAAMPGKSLRIVTEHMEEEFESRYIRILKAQDGDVVPVWDEYVSGTLKWNEDKSWTVTGSYCNRPAQFNYDKDEEKLVKFGRESFSRTKFTWSGDAMKTRVEKKWNDNKSHCQSEGRCPYVYAGASQTKLGEILRDQVGTENWRNEAIAVPRSLVDDGELVIRIAEEKPDELTFIDEVWLQVGHQKIRPLQCPPELCGKDRETMSLAPGEGIELRFSGVPKTGEIRLVANGYYQYIR